MLLDVLPVLRRFHVVLASASPRRLELVMKMGLNPTVLPSTFAEDLAKGGFDTPDAYAAATCRAKALLVWPAAGASALTVGAPCAVVIAADSIVVGPDGGVLEKPRDRAHAVAMITALSGATSRVVTATTIVVPVPPGMDTATAVHALATAARAASLSGVECCGHGAGSLPAVAVTWHRATVVHFDALPPSFIEAYVDTEEPYDKAGGYGIQSTASTFIHSIEGDYYTVMGLPVRDISHVLRAVAALWHGTPSLMAASDACPGGAV